MRHERTEIRVGKRAISRWREKLLVYLKVPVPQTDAGGRGENPETNGRILVKELGKMTPYLREKGCLLREAAEKRLKRLFSKNTGICESES